ncbi:5'-nucleotidase [Tenacibaculum sp. IB213877]|uniref:5'-nucleotidase n=1 Tax=Tenacibaculum sp. IB213877 TaxID=3097351 RepID=UPI002A5A1567|nr:5'-nucleotidase [Tenacibaculum sp. IB213877]MDY0779198.1 5'-nucleotidase [Tenacibaculum sp. IB213877]
MMKKILFILSLLAVFSCKKAPSTLTKITAKTIAIDSTLTSSEEINETIAPYKEKMLAEIEKKLTYAPKDLVRTDGEMQSSLGNLLADLCYQVSNPIFKEKTTKNIDFAMFNYGGIRAGIPEGDVKNKHAFQLMPFENKLVIAELSGDKVNELVQYFMSNQKAHPLSKNIQLTVTGNDYKLLINNKPFDNNKTYFVLTSDYLQGGGDKMNFFKDPVQVFNLDYKVRDAIITYFKNNNPLVSTIDNRVIIK